MSGEKVEEKETQNTSKGPEINCLEKLLGKKVKSPWTLGCFEDEDILAKTIQKCEEYKVEAKPKREEKFSFCSCLVE